MKIEHINNFANRCGHFYNAYIDENIKVNNGYNCNHPEQEEIVLTKGKEIGSCFCWSCPLGFEPTKEDFNDPDIENNDFNTPVEGELIVVKA